MQDGNPGNRTLRLKIHLSSTFFCNIKIIARLAVGSSKNTEEVVEHISECHDSILHRDLASFGLPVL